MPTDDHLTTPSTLEVLPSPTPPPASAPLTDAQPATDLVPEQSVDPNLIGDQPIKEQQPE